jgi:hypothetical protein
MLVDPAKSSIDSAAPSRALAINEPSVIEDPKYVGEQFSILERQTHWW